jgi:hypothetical protein
MAVNTRSRLVMSRIGMRYVRTFQEQFDDPIPGTDEGEVEYEILRTAWDTRPPARVCAAWNAPAPEKIVGGQGSTYLCGDVVLKPVLDEREATWLAGVLASLPTTDDLRVIRPVRAASGDWVVDGW